MIAQANLVGAIKSSGVSRVAVIDDAFDTPEISEERWGEYLDYLGGADGRGACLKAGLDETAVDLAMQAINDSEYDSDALKTCTTRLYKKFVDSLSDEYDPGGLFRQTKGDNLTNVIPVIQLLKSCMPDLEIVMLGAVDDVPTNTTVDVVFVDLYLDQSLDAKEAADNAKGDSAVKSSLARVEPFLSSSPSVILMSSHEHGLKADRYRTQLDEGVFASRFKFIAKQELRIKDEAITVEDKAAEALLDIFQSFKFSRGLDQYMKCWSTSAKAALNDVQRQVSELDLRELSYLVQFRLADEGQSLSSYLEWLIGELLLDSLSERLDANKGELNFKQLLSNDVAGLIDGAFDGPTDNIAKVYHKVRIDDYRSEPKDHFRLGDLYVRKQGDVPSSVMAIMNPDCDLITRKNGKRAVEEALLVHGDLQRFDAPKTSAGDFIIIENRPYNIAWKYKKATTLPFKKALEAPGGSDEELRYLGALKPLFAQEVQRNLIHSLGRVGVYVPPAFAISASAKVEVKQGSKKMVVPLEGLAESPCYYIPSRGGQAKGVAIFKRSFVAALESGLAAIDPKQPELATFVKTLKTEALAKLVKGVQIGSSVCGILITDNPGLKLSDAPNCWITITIPATED